MEVTSSSLVKCINSKTPITWRYVDTIQNPADVRSRGSNIKNLPKEWWDDARRLTYLDYWPKQNEITPTKESKKNQDDKRSHVYQQSYQLLKK